MPRSAAKNDSVVVDPPRVVEVGARFGRYIVASKAPPSQGQRGQWLCRCDCGTEKAVAAGQLRKGTTRSCGCLRREIVRDRNTKHGHKVGGRYTPEYIAWCNVIARCTNPRMHAYPNYGGRGITMCERWRSDFLAFLADMGPRPSADMQIDRIDNDGDYEPGNCRWATPKTNCRNRRSTRWVDVCGRRVSLVEAAERAGVSYTLVKGRVRAGWPVERALTEASHAAS